MRIRLSVPFLGGVLALVLLAILTLLFVFIGGVTLENLFFLLVGWLISAVIVQMVIIIGAFLMGMIVAYRVYTKSEFSPFEEEMLRMRGQIDTLLEEVQGLRAELGAAKGDASSSERAADESSSGAEPSVPVAAKER